MTSAHQSHVERWRSRLGELVEKPPRGWRVIRERVGIGVDLMPPFVHASGLLVVVTLDPAPSGVYLHLSISHRDRLPRWPEVVSARDAFFGSHMACVHAIPDARDHRDVHPFCLHVWARADGTPILDECLAEYVAPKVGGR